MFIESTPINDVFILNNFNTLDKRGKFVKTYNKDLFLEKNIDLDIRESYYSISNINVIRGMHFQIPPHDHNKLVYVCNGSIIDVVVDLRRKSKTFKKVFSIELSLKNKKSIYIPRGIAHGFRSLENNTITVYNVSSEYNQENDSGIKYDSLNYNWGIKNPILSKRDLSFDTLNSFCLRKIF